MKPNTVSVTYVLDNRWREPGPVKVFVDDIETCDACEQPPTQAQVVAALEEKVNFEIFTKLTCCVCGFCFVPLRIAHLWPKRPCKAGWKTGVVFWEDMVPLYVDVASVVPERRHYAHVECLRKALPHVRVADCREGGSLDYES